MTPNLIHACDQLDAAHSIDTLFATARDLAAITTLR